MQVLERWNFDIETDSATVVQPDKEHEKSEKVRHLSAPPPLLDLPCRSNLSRHAMRRDLAALPSRGRTS
jgi:hypothetical protein